MGVKVREKPKGSGVWWVFIDHEGCRKAKKIGTDEKLAHKAAEKISARLVLGELKVEKINVRGPSFRQCAEMWLALPHDWKESTKDSYSDILRIHVYPLFGKKPVESILRKDLKAFFNKLYTMGLHANTLKLIRAPFSGILSYAVELEFIGSNPFKDLKMQFKKKAHDVEPFNEAEAHLLLEASKSFMDGKYYPVMLLALRTGLRIGEIQALEWGDIDLENRQIEVKRSWRKGRITDTKSKKRRRVDMTPLLSEALKDHRIAQKRKALKSGKPVSDFVFTGDRGEILNRLTFQNALDRCCQAARLRKVRTHDLRHSYATIRLMRGHNVLDVSNQLGHSSPTITCDVYAHWSPGRFKTEIDALDNPQQSATYTQPKDDPSENSQSFQ